MANGWTPERRARQAELIRRWRPWEKSTGLKTQAGKEVVSRNAYKAWHLATDAQAVKRAAGAEQATRPFKS